MMGSKRMPKIKKVTDLSRQSSGLLISGSLRKEPNQHDKLNDHKFRDFIEEISGLRKS